MAYADSIRVNAPLMSDVASLIEGTLVNVQYSGVESIINTTSTSGADTDVSITVTCASGNKVIAGGFITVSRSAIGTVAATISLNGVDLTPWSSSYDSTSSTNGETESLPLFGFFNPAVGSNTFKIRYKTPSAGTLYSLKRALTVIVVRTS